MQTLRDRKTGPFILHTRVTITTGVSSGAEPAITATQLVASEWRDYALYNPINSYN
jgi:hypothetical protein